MGSAATAGIVAAVKNADGDQLDVVLEALSQDDRAKLQASLLRLAKRDKVETATAERDVPSVTVQLLSGETVLGPLDGPVGIATLKAKLAEAADDTMAPCLKLVQEGVELRDDMEINEGVVTLVREKLTFALAAAALRSELMQAEDEERQRAEATRQHTKHRETLMRQVRQVVTIQEEFAENRVYIRNELNPKSETEATEALKRMEATEERLLRERFWASKG